jgi:outer membrane protein OmpA-like peptidoglycan-associated protein
MNKYLPVLLALIVGPSGSYAQNNSPEQQNPNSVPVYRITVVGRVIKAINYRNRSGVTKVKFRGTSLMPSSVGDADVQSRQGTIKVDVRFQHVEPANRFGPEYMTFVLWAISPEGRPTNLGEVLPDHGGNATLNVTSDLQSFGMIVTAEPHFAVTQPSDVVVMENFVTNETNGTVQEVEANYHLLRRGQYTSTINTADITPLPVDEKTPIDVNEARNAIRIAKWAGAETYAGDTLKKAELDLQNAEDMLQSKKGNRKDIVTDAREAAQTAEDARLITVRKMEAEEQAHERQQTTEAQAQAAQAQAQAQEQANAAAQAQAQAEQAQRAREESEAAKRAADDQARQAQAAAQQAQLLASQAEREKTELRAKLQQQLNTILQTRDTARGLIMNMSDVLFDFGKYTLKPEAREKLAKLAGILLAYPGLSLEIDGYTDSIGSDEFNQTLSEQRAGAVRDYLTTQGVSGNLITAKGFGKTNPVASNDTAEGREQNRRVELVVSGDAIKAQAQPAPSGSQ